MEWVPTVPKAGQKPKCEICKFKCYIPAKKLATAKTFELAIKKSITKCNRYAKTRNMKIKFKVNLYVH